MALVFALALGIHVAKIYHNLELHISIDKSDCFCFNSVDRPTHHAEVLLLLLVAAGFALLMMEAVFGLDVTEVFFLLAPLRPGLGLASAAVILDLRAAGGRARRGHELTKVFVVREG